MEDWVITVISLIGSTAVSTIVGIIIKNSVSKKVDEHNELLELRAAREREERKQDVLNVVREELKPVVTKIDAMSSLVTNNTEGTVTLMRESMKQARDALVAQEYATASDVASWHELYNTYAKLGGNHFAEYVDAWKQDVEALPRHPRRHDN